MEVPPNLCTVHSTAGCAVTPLVAVLASCAIAGPSATHGDGDDEAEEEEEDDEGVEEDEEKDAPRFGGNRITCTDAMSAMASYAVLDDTHTHTHKTRR